MDISMLQVWNQTKPTSWSLPSRLNKMRGLPRRPMSCISWPMTKTRQMFRWLRRAAPIIFLDIDDVVCLNEHFGGHAALACVRGESPVRHADRVYRLLFAPGSVQALRAIHYAMGGRVSYVISSSWRQVFTLAQLRHVLREAGLDFVTSPRDVGLDCDAEAAAVPCNIRAQREKTGRGEAAHLWDGVFQKS